MGKIIKTETSRSIRIYIILFLIVPIFFMFDLFIGSYYIPVFKIIESIIYPNETEEQILIIIRDFRIPKALTAVLSGAALSVAGLQMQTIFRNPLAGPDILGISSGASLGVALLVLSAGSFMGGGFTSVINSWGITGAAWIGSGAVLLLIIMMSTRINDIMTILILGILISSGIIAVVNILQYFSNESMLKSFVVWTMGSLGSVTNTQLVVLIPSVILGLTIAWVFSKPLDAFLLGENYARSMGMNIRFTRIMIFTSTCILAGSITAFCGPIGFIGITVPHIARMLMKTARHGKLIPGSILIGSLVMLISDILAQLPGSERILPINAVTSLLGIPVVVWLIFRNKNAGYM